MPVTVKRKSRLRFGDLVTVLGYEFWNPLDLPVLEAQPDDSYYTVVALDRIDSIAAKFYGDPILWWVIAAANNMEMLPTELNVGAKIKIPAPRYVNMVLFTKALIR